ncbi:zinc-ribbon domain-containing protein [Sutcliffiella deserti]|uniref:zinc-ribbon domain-containing protein n=1 Tax=Sutcliffiella deserti TaxID=2875501 RepID=UPI001CBB1AC5|nr:zinc-ribbon domain-containing protein [Sutcliffiella deserti]
MFCHNCGLKVTSDAKYCSNCGANLKGEDNHIDEYGVIEEGRGLERTKKNNKKRYLPLILPTACFILLVGGIGWTYNHESKVNAQVLAIKNTAEEFALEGDYAQAKKELASAIDLRPRYHVLQNNLDVITIAEELEVELEETSILIKDKKYEEAQNELVRLREKVAILDGPLIQPLKKELVEKDTMIKVGKINSELDQLTTVEELARKLSVLSAIPSQEGNAVKEQILNRIVQITSTNAEEELAQKQFTKAITITDRGLQYAINDKRLLSLKEKIEQTRSEFELAELERIEKAMEAAAKEDLKNRNAALEIEGFKYVEDDAGGMMITGEVKNIVSTSVSSITVYYNILSKDKDVLDTGYTTVYPYKLMPGETAKFEDYYYGVFEEVTVEIENMTWLVEG